MTKIYHSKKYLIEQLKSKTYIQIAKENKVSPDTIQHHMNKHGLTKKRISWSKEELKLLKENYRLNPHVYTLFPNRSISSVNHKGSRLSLIRQNRKRVYTLNYDFFKNWKPEMAYILGLFFSDGNVGSDKRQANIHLHKNDYHILEKISKIMETNRPVKTYSDASYLRIDSKIIVNDLINLGCVPRKSLILKFPKIKDKFLSHFVRGYFDGDGSIYFNKPNTIKISFIGTKIFLEELQMKLHKLLVLKRHPIRKDRTFYLFEYYGDDARKLCEWMYKNSKGLYLERKKNRFDKHIMMRKNGRL